MNVWMYPARVYLVHGTYIHVIVHCTLHTCGTYIHDIHTYMVHTYMYVCMYLHVCTFMYVYTCRGTWGHTLMNVHVCTLCDLCTHTTCMYTTWCLHVHKLSRIWYMYVCMVRVWMYYMYVVHIHACNLVMNGNTGKLYVCMMYVIFIILILKLKY